MSTRSGEFVSLRTLREEVGNDAARFFYQIINYYPEFENSFNSDCADILERIEELSGDIAQ